MTVNIAFKAPDALVFVTDGLATLMKVEDDGRESFMSNMESVEKLLLLSNEGDERRCASVLAMFNGIGSLGGRTVATALRAIDRDRPRGARESVKEYFTRLADKLEQVGVTRLGNLPRPFHLIAAGFDTSDNGDAVPSIQALQWRADGSAPDIYPVMEAPGPNGELTQLYGAHYVGLTEAVARFVEGYDPSFPERFGKVLAGIGGAAPPGLLERLAQEACHTVGGPALGNIDVEALVKKYTYLIVNSAFHNAPDAELSQHFSLQSAIDYCVFLAQCAYAKENLSPSRKGPPKVGSTLQVAYLSPGEEAVKLAGIRLGIRVHGYTAAMGSGA